jgi:hypothetical protein
VICVIHSVTVGALYEQAVCGGGTGMVMSEDAMSKVPSRYSRLARAVIAMFVFAVGAIGGAGVAALLMPT